VLNAYLGRWSLVTGASSGIGAEFARQLAARGVHCVLAARREDRLQALAKELEAAHGIRCEIIAADLSQPHAGRDLLAAQEMVRRGRGGIITIGSVVSFQPVGFMGVYAASKAYGLHFSEALWAELRPRGVTVTTLCPGPTRTEFFDQSGVPGWAERNHGADVTSVVRTGLEAFDAGRQYVVAGWANYLVSLAVRLATRATVVRWSMSAIRPRADARG